MATAPIEFPPPVDSAREFVGAPTDPEDERIEVGVAIVGGGPAGLACAIRLSQLLAEDERLLESLGEVPIAVVEKGKNPGSHLLSGAMMKPSAMQKLFPDVSEDDWPTYGAVDKDTVYLLPNGNAALPQPRQPRHLGGAAGPLASREGGGGRRLRPRRDRCGQAAGRERQGGRR